MSSHQTPKSGASGGGASSSTTASNEDTGHLSPGSLVFAKMKSFPPWPAKVISAEDFPGSVPRNHIPVHFLGSGDFGHVTPKECFPYSEYRAQFGTPKQRPKHAEAIREAEELFNSQQKQQPSRKRPASKGREEKEKTATPAPPSAKKARTKTPKTKSDARSSGHTSTAQTTSHHEDEDLPASQLAEIAASTVFEPESHVVNLGEDTSKKGQSPTRGGSDDDDDEEYVDDAISNVVRQLEELEKQEADEKRRTNPESTSPMPNFESAQEPEEASASEAGRRARQNKKASVGNASGSAKLTRPQTLATESSSVPGRVPHQRSMSETTDDGRGAQSSGSETPLSGNELGKRRHKPKIMSEYFLEKDYASPRSHRKSESSAAPASASSAATPTSSGQTTKGQPKTVKTPTAERPTKAATPRGKKSGAGSSKATKDQEKAALEAEIERVRMAAEQNPAEQQQSAVEQQFWQRASDTFPDLPFDDSMFEVTVDVEEAPSGGAGGQTVSGETPTTSAAAKRRKDAAGMAKEKEILKNKEKLKVKLLKGLLPAPKFTPPTSAIGEKRKKKEKLAAVLAKKKPLASAGKMKVKIAKKKATKAAKLVVAAAEMKVQKKRGRKPIPDKKPKHEKRISGYSLWAEVQMPLLKQERPELKGLRQIHEILKERFNLLPDSEKKTWHDKAQIEKDKRAAAGGSVQKKAKQQPTPMPSASAGLIGDGKTFYGRLAGTATSPKGYTPSSPRGSRMYVLSPQQGQSPSIEVQQQPHLAYDQGAVMGGQVNVYQMATSGIPEPTYGGISDPSAQGAYAANYGMQEPQEYNVQASTITPSPAKRPRGRPPKSARTSDQPPQKIVPRPQMRLSDASPQHDQGMSMSFQTPASQKSLKTPKKEASGKKQAKPPLKILTAGQRRAPFQMRSPMMHSQGLVPGALDEPPVPEAMSHEELVYDSETAAMAAAAAAAMDMGNAGMVVGDGMVDQMEYGHVDPHGQHELGQETEAAVSYLTGDQSGQLGTGPKSKEQLEEERAAKKRESRRRSRAKQRAVKEQKKLQPGQQPATQTVRGQLAAQYGADQGAYTDQSVVTAPPAAYEDAYVEPRPSEEDTNLFFFGTTQDVQALLEMRNTPAAMEGQCRWWLADEADPELLGGKNKGRGASPPRPLTAEPLDAAAVFKLIGRTFENVGNQLMREEGEDTPHEVAAGMDMLLDGLVSSISHLLTLTGAISPFDRRYRRDVAARLVEDTSMMIPL